MTKMSSGQVTIHLGCEKTGTTSIQDFLVRNRAALADAGWRYSTLPDGSNHQALVAYTFADEPGSGLRASFAESQRDFVNFRRGVRDQLRSEIGTDHHLLISSEHFSSRVTTRSQLEELRHLFAGLGAEVRGVLYLRRQPDMLESSWSTMCKSGATRPLDVEREMHDDDRYDFPRLVQRWSDFLEGRLTVRVFREEWRDDSLALVRDFMGAVGVPWSSDVWAPPALHNRALSSLELEVLLCLNRLVEDTDDPRLRSLARAVAAGGIGSPTARAKHVLSDRERHSIWEHWRERNEGLRGVLDEESLDYLLREPQRTKPSPLTLASDVEESFTRLAHLVEAVWSDPLTSKVGE